MAKYTQLTADQRCQIYILHRIGKSQRTIAEIVKVNQSTISRELYRNKGKTGYRYKQAQRMCSKRRLDSVQITKMLPDTIAMINQYLQKKWSPEQISGWLLASCGFKISHESIYLHIWSNKRSGGMLYKHLRRKGKAYISRSNALAGRGHIKNRVSISERPKVVDEKTRIGDWEIDLVVGKSHSGMLVTIVERGTSFTVSRRINNKSAATVTAATISLLKPYQDAVLTITADNGKEFAYHEQIAAALDASVYFADPYSSWQRGLNENTNGLLRQWWPKSTDFKLISHKEVEQAILELNNRPRKKLNYKTPADLMAGNMAALAA